MGLLAARHGSTIADFDIDPHPCYPRQLIE
jgi:hypothetical protein